MPFPFRRVLEISSKVAAFGVQYQSNLTSISCWRLCNRYYYYLWLIQLCCVWEKRRSMIAKDRIGVGKDWWWWKV